jgi:Group II intron, maturase-specific domain
LRQPATTVSWETAIGRKGSTTAVTCLASRCSDAPCCCLYAHEKFDFLGYTFRPRTSKNRAGKHFINFSPAVSDNAVKNMRTEIRSWNLPLRSDKSIEDLSRMFNPIIRGWLQYYGRYYRSALYPPMRQLDRSLATPGLSEIQEAAWASAQGDTLGGTDIRARFQAVVALAHGCAAWFHGGSCMS